MAGVAELVEQVNGLSEDERNEFVIGMVEKMSVLGLSTLVKKVEEKFDVKASGGGGIFVPPTQNQGNQPQAVEEKTEFTVTLKAVADSTKKMGVIKEVRGLTGLGLKESKDLVESAPKTVKEKLTKADAESMKAKLEAAGATVELS